MQSYIKIKKKQKWNISVKISTLNLVSYQVSKLKCQKLLIALPLPTWKPFNILSQDKIWNYYFRLKIETDKHCIKQCGKCGNTLGYALIYRSYVFFLLKEIIFIFIAIIIYTYGR